MLLVSGRSGGTCGVVLNVVHVVYVLGSVSSFSASIVCQVASSASFFPPLPFSPVIFQTSVMVACFLAWGLMAGKPLDIPGTQPPLLKAMQLLMGRKL